MELTAIVARSNNGIIGKEGKLPWKHLPGDGTLFRSVTEGHLLVCGRATYESIPKPFDLNRNFLVLSNKANYKVETGDLLCSSITTAKEIIANAEKPSIIIGGGQIYDAFKDSITAFHVVEPHVTYEGDVAMDLPDNLTLRTIMKITDEFVYSVYTKGE